MTTYYKLRKDAVMTDEERQEIAEARKKPIVYDDDSPELTPEMEKAFIEARKEKPYRGRKKKCEAYLFAFPK